MREYPWFPMFFNIGDRRALIVGGGAVAARRAATLSRFCGNIAVVAPKVRPEITALPGVQVVKRPFEPGDLEGADLVIAATDDHALNADIARRCRERGVPVNTASDRALCDFYFPGIAMRGTVVAGITAGGKGPQAGGAGDAGGTGSAGWLWGGGRRGAFRR